MADELEEMMWAQRGTVRRALTGDGAKPSVVPWELRGLDAGAGVAEWRQETAGMDADMVSRVQPLLDELNATLDGPKLGIVHKDLHAWALNFNAGRSGGYTGRGRGDVRGGVFVTTWPPWTSMGLLVDEHGNTDGRVGNRLLDPKGRASDTGLCLAMKWRFIYGKDGPQSLGDLYSRDNLRGCDVSQMDAAAIDIVGNTKHALPSWLLGFREELAEGTFLQVVLGKTNDGTFFYAERKEGLGIYRSALAMGAQSIAADDFTEFDFDDVRDELCVGDPRLAQLPYSALSNKELLATICHGACLFRKTGVIIVVGWSSCMITRSPASMADR
ncbi:hypothetical protein T484DRAFT_1856952, partial [Baffinella frigidus]